MKIDYDPEKRAKTLKEGGLERPSRQMTNSKSNHEMSVFLDFARAAGIALDTSSVESRDPPEPDIRCKVGGKRCYYELGRILDDYMQRHRKAAFKNALKLQSINPRFAGLPERPA